MHHCLLEGQKAPKWATEESQVSPGSTHSRGTAEVGGWDSGCGSHALHGLGRSLHHTHHRSLRSVLYKPFQAFLQSSFLSVLLAVGRRPDAEHAVGALDCLRIPIASVHTTVLVFYIIHRSPIHRTELYLEISSGGGARLGHQEIGGKPG